MFKLNLILNDIIRYYERIVISKGIAMILKIYNEKDLTLLVDKSNIKE